MFDLFITVALVNLVALMSPGPDFFFISQTAISRSRIEAIKGALGVSLAVAIWATIALLGLNLILEKMSWLHKLIMVGGGVYLVWMGVQLLMSARSQHKTPNTEAALALSLTRRNSFFRGLLTNLSNPKAIIYFSSVFSIFVGPDVSSLVRVGIFGVIIGETLLWFSLVALLFSLPWMREKYRRLAKWIDGFAGALFTLFGIHLILSR